MKRGQRQLLYRKVNTRARGVHHDHGGDYRHGRRSESPLGMRSGVQRGRDYTPLFMFLLSRVGSVWNEVHSEAVGRLDRRDPIFWLVSLDRENADEVVLSGETSYYSGLFVDEDGLLQIVAPNITKDTLEPSCSCCTHTFNGIPFTKKCRG